MSREDPIIDKLLEDLLGPVVGELGVRVARYLVYDSVGTMDKIFVNGGLKPLADALGMTGRGRLAELSSVLDALSSLRLETSRMDTWLLMWSRSPRTVILTVGRGLNRDTLDSIVRMTPEERSQVRIVRTQLVRVRA